MLFKYYIFVATLSVIVFPQSVSGQVVRAVRPFSTAGTIKEISRGNLLMSDKSGRSWQLRFSGADGVVKLAKNVKFVAPKPVVEISGSLSRSALKEGLPIRFECYVNDEGRVG